MQAAREKTAHDGVIEQDTTGSWCHAARNVTPRASVHHPFHPPCSRDPSPTHSAALVCRHRVPVRYCGCVAGSERHAPWLQARPMCQMSNTHKTGSSPVDVTRTAFPGQ